MSNVNQKHIETMAERYAKERSGLPPKIIPPSTGIGYFILMDENGIPVKKEDLDART